MGCFPWVPCGLLGVLIRGSQAFARGLRGLQGFFVSRMGGLGVLRALLPLLSFLTGACCIPGSCVK